MTILMLIQIELKQKIQHHDANLIERYNSTKL